MKTPQILAAVMLVTGIFTTNAQNVASTANLTSGGLQAGAYGSGNTFFGYQAGKSTGAAYAPTNCTIIGHLAAPSIGTGVSNVVLGHRAGENLYDGNENVLLGTMAGQGSNDNSNNVMIGFSAGYNNNGNRNTFIGNSAGFTNDLSGNIFLGYNAGYNETTSNKLYIENSNSSTPLIWGDFANDLLKFNGKVGIGLGAAAFPTTGGSINVAAYKLIVNGGILAKEVRVATTWADYVFEDTYNLPTLPEVECYINENGHLPNVPSAKQVEENGIEVGQMAKIQQEKIEELTLYAIAQQKQLDKQEKEIQELKALVLKLAESK